MVLMASKLQRFCVAQAGLRKAKPEYHVGVRQVSANEPLLRRAVSLRISGDLYSGSVGLIVTMDAEELRLFMSLS